MEELDWTEVFGKFIEDIEPEPMEEDNEQLPEMQ